MFAVRDQNGSWIFCNDRFNIKWLITRSQLEHLKMRDKIDVAPGFNKLE